MAEKNTLSILENIKKKMQKFDQEPKKIETVAGINDEFEYIPSSKAKSSDVKIEGSAEQKSAADAASEIDKEFAPKTGSESSAAVTPSKPAPQNYGGIEDDLGLDDLSDLEDTYQPQVAAPVAPANVNKSPVIPEPQQAPVVSNHDDLHELNLDDHHEEPKVEVKKEEHDEFDLNFDLDLDLEEEKTPQDPVKSAEPVVTPVVEAPKPVTPTPQSPSQNIDDIDLDKLLAEEDASRKQGQEKTAPVIPPKPTISADDEAFLKELEASDPIKTQAPNMPIPPVAQVQATPPVTPPTPPVDKKVEDKKSLSEELARDVDLEDLDDIEEQMFADSSAKTSETAAPAVQNSQPQRIKEEIVTVKEDVLPEVKKEHRPIAPLDLSSVEKTYISPDKDLEEMLENRHFSEVAMHLLESKLDNWLAEHLHGVVEKIVQEEVKKLFDKR